MAYFESGVDATKATVGTTSKAVYVELRDSAGLSVSQKSTFCAATVAKTATAAGTAPFFSIYGSASKIIRIQFLRITATVGTAAVYGDIVVSLRTAAISGGTATTLTQVAMDGAGTGTATNVKFYTAMNATPGTGGGDIAGLMQFCPITGTPALGPGTYEFDWRLRNECQPIILNSTSQGIEAKFATTTTNAPTMTVEVIWTEE